MKNLNLGLVLLFVLAVAASGCISRKVKHKRSSTLTKAGETNIVLETTVDLSRRLTNEKIKNLQITVSSNGTWTLTLQGMESDQTAAITATGEVVVKAMQAGK